MKNIFNRIISRFRSLSTHQEVYDIYFLQKVMALENHILHDDRFGVSDSKYCGCDLIVSLTTYGKRIWEVAITIESIMQQTMLPNRIILNLDYSYRDKHLPISLKKQMDRGLEIQYCKDLRSYKKLIPTMEKYPSDLIITVDDDLIYDFDLVERLYNSYITSPNQIHAARTHVMTFKNGFLNSYNDWSWCASECENNKHLFFTGGAGVLYPSACLDEEVLNENVFTKICPTADDVWFNAMALKKGTEIVKVQTRNIKGEDYIVNERVQDVGLFHQNTGLKCENDKQIEAVFSRYNLYGLLK